MSERSNIVDFEGFKRKKYGLDRPLFSEPATIYLGGSGDSTGSKFSVVANLVQDGRQYLALRRLDQEEGLFTIVKGIVDKGALVSVDPLSKEEYPAIKELFKDIFAKATKKAEQAKWASGRRY
ncbi:hypothetical protein RZN22_14385 [Bacillaceae bacterium S4-13-58]